MPKEVFGKDYTFLPRRELLSFEEIERIARVFVGLGVEKIRLTGGEPLLRKDLEYLIELLATLRTPHGKDVELTLTTNGSLLSRKARSLRCGIEAHHSQSRLGRRGCRHSQPHCWRSL
jgi:cyclic pyranopterin phosphate synthase